MGFGSTGMRCGAVVTVVSHKVQPTAHMANGPTRRASLFAGTTELLESPAFRNNPNGVFR